MQKNNDRKCPKCASDNVVPIIYGLPAGELFEQSDRGEIKLGGCMILPEKWHCKDCGHDFK